MYDILNPCNCDSAWWQHLLMLAVPLLLGFLWGRGQHSDVEVDESASIKIAELDAALTDCRHKTNTAEASLAAGQPSKPQATAFAAHEPALKADFTAPSATVAAPPSGLAAAAAKPKKDDLKVVEGIGPKIESLFNESGIYTFGQLAGTPASRLKEILDAAGSRFQMHDPTTWPAQSKLAEDGKWEELKKWQDELNKGQA